MEDQGSLVESSEIFITRPLDNQRAGSFWRQRISMGLHRAKWNYEIAQYTEPDDYTFGCGFFFKSQ